MTLTRPHAPFLTTVIPSLLIIQPKHIYEGTDPLTNEYNDKPIGTGAFMFESWEGDTITLVRNEDYFGGRPGYERVVFQVVPDPTSRANALRGGEIDFLSSNDVNATVLDLVRDDDTIHLERGRATHSMGTLYFNTRNPPLDNPEVRKALYTALDKELLAQAIDPDGATIPVSGIASNSPFSAPDDVDYRELFAYDPAKAEQMLDEAGFHAARTAPASTSPTATSARRRQAPTRPRSSPTSGETSASTSRSSPRSGRSAGPAIYEQNVFDTGVRNLSARLDPITGFVPRYQCWTEPVINQNPTGYCNPEFEALTEQAASRRTSTPGTTCSSRCRRSSPTTCRRCRSSSTTPTPSWRTSAASKSSSTPARAASSVGSSDTSHRLVAFARTFMSAAQQLTAS